MSTTISLQAMLRIVLLWYGITTSTMTSMSNITLTNTIACTVAFLYCCG